MAELVPEAAEQFQANRITAGHALLIARLPQEQQRQALDVHSAMTGELKERHAVSVRELAQWIRENLGRALLIDPGPAVCGEIRSDSNRVFFEYWIAWRL